MTNKQIAETCNNLTEEIRSLWAKVYGVDADTNPYIPWHDIDYKEYTRYDLEEELMTRTEYIEHLSKVVRGKEKIVEMQNAINKN